MYGTVIAIHVIASLFLIAVILLQAGRGGGLADSFGGSQMQSLFGTQSANVMTKLTTICATLFVITCLTLAIISSRRTRSIVDKANIPVPLRSVAEEVVDMARPEVMEEMPIVPEETPVVSEEMPEVPIEAPAE